MFHHTSRKTSRRDVEALESLESFKISASVSKAATSRLGLGLEGLVHIPDACVDVFRRSIGGGITSVHS